MEKAKFMVRFRGQWITCDDNAMKYVGGKERPVCIDTSVDFEIFMMKICYHLRIDQS